MKRLSKFFIFLSILSSSKIFSDITLLEDDIKIIYDTFVKPNYTDEYKMRYSSLPMNKNNKSWPWEGKDFPRVIQSDPENRAPFKAGDEWATDWPSKRKNVPFLRREA